MSPAQQPSLFLGWFFHHLFHVYSHSCTTGGLVGGKPQVLTVLLPADRCGHRAAAVGLAMRRAIHRPCAEGSCRCAAACFVTGGIHMDGFMDTSDALASWHPKERRLEILKDSHVDAFAVLGCAGYLLLHTALLSKVMAVSGIMLCGVFVLSQALSAWRWQPSKVHGPAACWIPLRRRRISGW